MKKYLALSVAFLLVLSVGAGVASANGQGGNPGKGNGNSGNGFGSYVSTLSDENIPYAMNQLDLEFGEYLVEPYTPATDDDPEIHELKFKGGRTGKQWWVVSPDMDGVDRPDLAIQWYTWGKEDYPVREYGHDYVVVWTEEKLGISYDDYYWRSYNFHSGSGFPIDGNGVYYAYLFDVTHIGQD